VLKFNAQNNAIDFKKKLQEKKVSLFATTCSLGQFDEKINHTKFVQINGRMQLISIEVTQYQGLLKLT
jgi:hypothetical protein